MTDIPSAMQQAGVHHQARRFGQAERLYRTVLAANPQHADATHYLGLIAAEAGQFEEAVKLVERSIELQAGNANFHLNYSHLLLRMGRAAPAVEQARRATELRPDQVGILRHLASTLSAAQRFAEAAQTWSQVVRREPADAMAQYQLAMCHDVQGELEPALAAYAEALRLRPDFVEALTNLAGILARVGRREEAVTHLREANRLRPGNAAIESTLGAVLIELGHVGEGLRLTRDAVVHDAKDPNWRWNLAHALSTAGQLDEAINQFTKAIEIAPQWAALYSDLLLLSQYILPDEPEKQLDMHRQYEQRYGSRNSVVSAAQRRVERAGERLKLGYVSADLRTHPVGYFIEPLLAAHDRKRLEVHCFNNHPNIKDELTRRIKASVDGWHQIDALTDEQAEALIRSLGIDILIDLAGHTGANHLGLFARKCAALQVTYLGYQNTTGLSSIDVRVTDAIADPPGVTDRYHTEKLLRLPGSFGLFRPIDSAPPVAEAPAVRAGHITLGCVARIVKINELMLSAWSQVMQHLPGAKLILIGTGYEDSWLAAALRERFVQHAIDPGRIELIGQRPFDEYLRLHERIDLMLDTYPFNGHTTTLQNLWMGVPVVTLAGESHRSRMGASVLTCLGLPELISHTVDEYVKRIVEVASDMDQLSSLRAGMRQRMLDSALTDAAGFARNFEAILIEAWQSKVNGQEP